jgi:hypothetical protein
MHSGGWFKKSERLAVTKGIVAHNTGPDMPLRNLGPKVTMR